MERFELAPVLRPSLPDVAAFLHRWRSTEAGGSGLKGSGLKGSAVKKPVHETIPSLERRLRWLLLENPVATTDGTLGYCLRDEHGTIRGLNLCHPVTFLSGNKRLLGLCSGSFFVEPPARTLGFFLFKKFLNVPDYAFYFASTCNTNSSQLWRSIGGVAVPNSETEYILPLRLNAMIPAYVASRTSNQTAARIARMCGRGADPMLRLLRRPATKLAIEPCQDWDKLAELARRHRSPDHITSDRSAALLQWRYGSGSPSHPCGIYLFRDKLGNEGWFSLGHFTRGEARKFRASVLLDAVWPRAQMNFRGIFQEILRLTAASADAISFRGAPGLDYSDYSRFMIPRNLGAPRMFVSMPKGAARLPLDSLDYDDSDYIAWTFQWREA